MKYLIVLMMFILGFGVDLKANDKNGCADLKIEKIQIKPKAPTTHSNIEVMVMVMNIGGAPSTPSALTIRIGGESNPSEHIIPALFPKKTFQVLRKIKLNVAQNYRITAVADATKNIRECNENNNESHLDFTVISACADLMVESFTKNIANPTTASNITFTAVIKNIGNAPSVASKAGIKLGGESTPQLYPVPALAPNATFTVSRSGVLNVAQNYMCKAFADYNSEVRECNETNNEKSITFPVTR